MTGQLFCICHDWKTATCASICGKGYEAKPCLYYVRNLEDEVSPKEEDKTCSPNLKLFSAAAAATMTVKTTTESMAAVGDTFVTDYCREQ